MEDNTTALCKHAINSHHDIDWNNTQILEFETDYKKRRFIESFFINNFPNTINDRKSISLPSMFFELKKMIHHFVLKKLIFVSLEPVFKFVFICSLIEIVIIVIQIPVWSYFVHSPAFLHSVIAHFCDT